MKLHLGCGDMILPEWINCDLYAEGADVQCDVRSLPFLEDSVDEIYSSHVIEHFNFHDGIDTLREWRRVLKPNGMLVIECPDFLSSCRKVAYASDDEMMNLYPHFFGMPWLPGGAHLFMYTPTQMRWTLDSIGMKNIHQDKALRYIGKEDISMKFICQK